MPGWAAFSGLTVVVLFVFLGLARLSQGVVDEDPPQLPASDESARTTTASAPVDGEPIETTDEVRVREPVAPGTEPTEPWETDPTQPEMTTSMLLVNVAITQGLFGGLIAAGAWLFEIPPKALGLAGNSFVLSAAAVGVGVAFGVVLWAGNELSAAVADAVGAAYDESLRGMLAPDSAGGWVVLLGVILPIIALVEELLFRVALISVPAAGFGFSPWALAIVSSALFALGHGAQGRVGIAVTGGLGLVLAGGYILSGSFLVVVVAHYLVNALEFVVHEGLGVDRLLG